MRNKLMILAVAAVAGVISVPFAAHADDATSLTNQAVVELTDPPGVGGRTTVDPNKRWGSDVGQIAKATALLQEARSKSTGNASANRLLEEAIRLTVKRKSTKKLVSPLQARSIIYAKGQSGDPCDKVNGIRNGGGEATQPPSCTIAVLGVEDPRRECLGGDSFWSRILRRHVLSFQVYRATLNEVRDARIDHCLLPPPRNPNGKPDDGRLLRNELKRFGPLLGSQVKTKFSRLTNRSVSPWCARL
jgi:hypothetical protein